MDDAEKFLPVPVEIAKGNGEFPQDLPILLLSDQVVFPMSVVPIRVKNPGELRLLDDVVGSHRLVGLLASRHEGSDDAGLDQACEVGTVGRVLQLQHIPDGSVNVLLQSIVRFRVMGLVQRDPYLVAKVQVLEERRKASESIAPLAATVKNLMVRMIHLSPNIPESAGAVLDSIEDPGFLADLVSGNLNISMEEKQKLLETLDRKDRLERLTYLLAREVEILELSDKIQTNVKNAIDKSQREYFLREQLKAIQNELGEGGSQRPEVAEYRRQLDELDLKEEVRKEALRELDRLEQMNEASAEYHVITTYLDWVVGLPWNKVTSDRLDLNHAETILNTDHYGLDKVKQRILEFLAVRKLKPDAPGPILCFVGPPGVGKTSLGQSIARTMGRKFVRMSLGGMRDEAEIRGHRKTYVGALPGRIIQSIRKAGSSNPVFMLDEIDKVGMDFRGDPSSALLEVLDPAQNDSFTDHYLNVPFDLSRVTFIATANILDTIPWALRDRMEVIEIPGYTLEEKLQIGRRYLVPRQVEAHGLTKKKLTFTMGALRGIVNDYTREAGVRNLEREIANVCRGCASAFARGRRRAIQVDRDALRTYLGNPRVYHQVTERTRMPGVATGMAWTPVGGDILFVEATRMSGKGNLVLTGQLGDVMKESAHTVISYIRANAEKLGVPADFFSESDIHIHVPAGGVPKDGPSAGVTILTAAVSLLTGKRVKARVAMTGEITLRGLVLPVGGIKEKVLAAARAGVREVILPERCRHDLDEVPESVKKRMTFHFVNEMAEVLAIALGIKA